MSISTSAPHGLEPISIIINKKLNKPFNSTLNFITRYESMYKNAFMILSGQSDCLRFIFMRNLFKFHFYIDQNNKLLIIHSQTYSKNVNDPTKKVLLST